MSKIKFVGVPGEDLDTISMYGQDFPRGKAVDAKGLSQTQVRKLASHPHFEVTGRDAEDVDYTEKVAVTKAVDLGQPNVVLQTEVVSKKDADKALEPQGTNPNPWPFGKSAEDVKAEQDNEKRAFAAKGNKASKK
jgi:hypothetical protein